MYIIKHRTLAERWEFTRVQRDCAYPFRIGRRWSCRLKARSRSCAPGLRRPRSFPLYTSSPRRRLERRASKRGHGHFTAGIQRFVDWERLRQGANIERANTRFGADLPNYSRLREFSIHTVDATVTIWLPERRGCAVAPRSPRLAQRWVATEHAPLPLPYCYVMGTRPRATKPSIINQIVTVFCTNSYQSLSTQLHIWLQKNITKELWHC